MECNSPSFAIDEVEKAVGVVLSFEKRAGCEAYTKRTPPSLASKGICQPWEIGFEAIGVVVSRVLKNIESGQKRPETKFNVAH